MVACANHQYYKSTMTWAMHLSPLHESLNTEKKSMHQPHPELTQSRPWEFAANHPQTCRKQYKNYLTSGLDKHNIQQESICAIHHEVHTSMASMPWCVLKVCIFFLPIDRVQGCNLDPTLHNLACIELSYSKVTTNCHKLPYMRHHSAIEESRFKQNNFIYNFCSFFISYVSHCPQNQTR